MAENFVSSNQHVAVLVYPFTSHPGVLLGLTAKLAKAAPNVTFSFCNTLKSNTTLFKSLKLDDNVRVYDVPSCVPEEYVLPVKPYGEDIEFFLKFSPQNYRKAVELAEEEVGQKISCVVADALLWFGADLAEEHGVPWVAVWAPMAQPLSAQQHTDLLRQSSGDNDKLDEALKSIPGFSEVRLEDLPADIISGDLMNSPWATMIYKMGQQLPRATALAINSIQELEPSLVLQDLKSTIKNVLNVGPLGLTHLPPSSDEHGCIPWLDKQEKQSVAYIGFGNFATPEPHELKALAEALEESRVPFIWSIKDNARKFLPEKSFEMGKFVPWAPQMEILRHESVGVFVTHCGANSVNEGIFSGVPIIARPFRGDQPLNAWLVERVLKIGVRLEGDEFTKDGTIRALKTVLRGEAGKKMKERSLECKEVALKAVGPNGSSTTNFCVLVDVITKRT